MSTRTRSDSVVSVDGEPTLVADVTVMAEALVHACETDDLKAVKNANADALALPTPSGNYALHIAVEHGAMAVVRYLVGAADFDVDIRDSEQWTPLHYAATFQGGKPEIAHYLLSHGADARAEDQDGDTPLAAHLDDADMSDAAEDLTRDLLESVAEADAYEPWAREHCRDDTFAAVIKVERPTYATASARQAFAVLHANAGKRQCTDKLGVSPAAFLLGAHGGHVAFDHLLTFLG